jgi:hypothetical protein
VEVLFFAWRRGTAAANEGSAINLLTPSVSVLLVALLQFLAPVAVIEVPLSIWVLELGARKRAYERQKVTVKCKQTVQKAMRAAEPVDCSYSHESCKRTPTSYFFIN